MEGTLLAALTRAVCRAEDPNDIPIRLLLADIPDLPRQFGVSLFARMAALPPVGPRM